MCQKSFSLPARQTFYKENGPQELCVPFKFDCAKTGHNAFRVLFSNNRAHPWSLECGSRWTHGFGRIGFDRTYKALKISGHNWMEMKDQLSIYLSTQFAKRSSGKGRVKWLFKEILNTSISWW